MIKVWAIFFARAYP